MSDIKSPALHPAGENPKCVKDWLNRNLLSAKEGLLLLTSLDPFLVGGVKWEPSGSGYCTINYMDNLVWDSNFSSTNIWPRGRERDPNTKYHLPPKDEVEKEILDLDKEARANSRDQIELISSLSGGEPLTADQIPSQWECRDHQRYCACKEVLLCYEKSEKLLNKFVQRWLDTGHNLKNEGIEIIVFLKWAYDTGLNANVSWWQRAVTEGYVSVEELQHEGQEFLEEGKVLTGWKPMAKHMDCHWETAKKKLRRTSYIKRNSQGKPYTTTATLDRYLTSSR